MQVQIVRHDGRANDSDGNIDHPSVAEIRRDQSPTHLQKIGVRLWQYKNLNQVTNGDGRDQDQHDRLNSAHSVTLQGQQQQNIQASDDYRPQQRNVEHQIESDRAAEYFGKVAGSDC